MIWSRTRNTHDHFTAGLHLLHFRGSLANAPGGGGLELRLLTLHLDGNRNQRPRISLQRRIPDPGSSLNGHPAHQNFAARLFGPRVAGDITAELILPTASTSFGSSRIRFRFGLSPP